MESRPERSRFPHVGRRDVGAAVLSVVGAMIGLLIASTFVPGLTVDLFNAFNRTNVGCYDTGNRQSKDALGRSTFGLAHCSVTDGRRVQFGSQVDF